MPRFVSMAVTQKQRDLRCEYEDEYDRIYEAVGQDICSVFLDNVALDITSEQLYEHMQNVGQVAGLRILEGTGFAVIDYSDHQTAAKAVMEVNNSYLGKMKLRCYWGGKERTS
ncbi:DEKNAAC104518 [Brettanomyces naardenensis]|uniref:DEKNAAC104518 n=1 Tax=Brettanomyces naardenensis TaxID=13370 RepID=A0A448YR56_BRENA|nr:DEKNAAC104518 [Brettanomyces naardenensis]